MSDKVNGGHRADLIKRVLEMPKRSVGGALMGKLTHAIQGEEPNLI